MTKTPPPNQTHPYSEIHALLSLFRSDYPTQITPSERRELLNRVAYTLQEAGWGLYMEDADRPIPADDVLVNTIQGIKLQVLTMQGQLRSLPYAVEEFTELSRFLDPIDVEFKSRSPLPFTPRTPPEAFEPGGEGVEMAQQGPGEPVPPIAPTAAAEDLQQTLTRLSLQVTAMAELWPNTVHQIGQILEGMQASINDVRDQVQRGYTITTRIMGVPVTVTVTPIAPPPVQNPVDSGTPPA